jgi:hypothetical protein
VELRSLVALQDNRMAILGENLRQQAASPLCTQISTSLHAECKSKTLRITSLFHSLQRIDSTNKSVTILADSVQKLLLLYKNQVYKNFLARFYQLGSTRGVLPSGNHGPS